MDPLDGLRTFAAVAESGGFSAAAARLRATRGVVSKRLAALERQLGVQLLQRTTRRVALTEAGHAFHRKATQILAAYDEARTEIGELQGGPRGTLKVSAPMSFGIRYLAPVIGPFMAECGELKIELALNDRSVDLLEEGFDVGIRIGALRDSSLVARRLAPVAQLLCAAPAYLERHGAPRRPADLERHRCLHYGHASGGTRWRFAGARGSAAITVQPVLTANNGDVLRQVALDGGGIAMLPDFLVGPDVTAGRLVALLPAWRTPEAAVQAVWPAGRIMTAKLRRFVDFLRRRFAAPPWQLAD